ncbi:hypothetical protein QBC38DRAFT_288021 [Podospora fimiseda]|uniref:Uncharacterized protein n=1 Tax=Podospora fimiseda TaxID=252190 RepID=A0AAN7GXV0_9PEZI|nr:hypothetical protein QBC38DRAFT_288021 [Podospora fimiseda]
MQQGFLLFVNPLVSAVVLKHANITHRLLKRNKRKKPKKKKGVNISSNILHFFARIKMNVGFTGIFRLFGATDLLESGNEAQTGRGNRKPLSLALLVGNNLLGPEYSRSQGGLFVPPAAEPRETRTALSIVDRCELWGEDHRQELQFR